MKVTGGHFIVRTWCFKQKMASKTRFSLHDVISMLEDEDFDTADIFMEPSPNDAVSDEDSADEDGATGTIDNLSGRQLRSGATITLTQNRQRTRWDDEEDLPDFGYIQSQTEDVPTTSKRGKKKTPRFESENERTWKRQDIPPAMSQRFTCNQPADNTRLPQTPTELFELFFDDEVIDAIVEFSHRYSVSKGNTSFSTTAHEIRTFLAIFLVSGYNPVARRRLYWSYDDDVRNGAIAVAMTRNRFDEIVRYVHLCDNNTLDESDKMAKVRPIMRMMNERCLLYFQDSQNLSIDESMIPYYGRHGAKQFIRGKPIRFGFKMWVLATSDGYVIQFEPYVGATGKPTSNLGMGGDVVIDLLSQLKTGVHYHVTCDNLFTSLALTEELTKRGIAFTGTVRANRLRDCPLKLDNQLKNAERGSYDFSYDEINGTIVVKWNDNNVVTVMSNYVGIAPVEKANRWSRATKQRMEIDQPHVIHHYNRTMGGVDRMDQNIATYRTAIRSKKWWWSIFVYLVDMCVQQTWLLYRTTDAAKEMPLDLLAVRREIAKVYLAKAKPTTAGRPRFFLSTKKRVPDAVRYDKVEHLVIPNKTQLRCAACGKKTTRKCRKCNVGLHDKCFISYHERT